MDPNRMYPLPAGALKAGQYYPPVLADIDWTKYDYTVDYAADHLNFNVTGISGGVGTRVTRVGMQGVRLSTTRYNLYGKFTIPIKAIGAAGIVTTFITMSDRGDEIDVEILPGANPPVTSNLFYKRILEFGVHGGASGIPSGGKVDDGYHQYTIDWNSQRIIWSIDGTPVRTYKQSDSFEQNSMVNGEYYYPSTPSVIQFGVWDGGDSDSSGVSQWAGGPVTWTSDYFEAQYGPLVIQCYDDKDQPVDMWPVQGNKGSQPNDKNSTSSSTTSKVPSSTGSLTSASSSFSPVARPAQQTSTPTAQGLSNGAVSLKAVGSDLETGQSQWEVPDKPASAPPEDLLPVYSVKGTRNSLDSFAARREKADEALARRGQERADELFARNLASLSSPQNQKQNQQNNLGNQRSRPDVSGDAELARKIAAGGHPELDGGREMAAKFSNNRVADDERLARRIAQEQADEEMARGLQAEEQRQQQGSASGRAPGVVVVPQPATSRARSAGQLGVYGANAPSGGYMASVPPPRNPPPQQYQAPPPPQQQQQVVYQQGVPQQQVVYQNGVPQQQVVLVPQQPQQTIIIQERDPYLYDPYYGGYGYGYGGYGRRGYVGGPGLAVGAGATITQSQIHGGRLGGWKDMRYPNSYNISYPNSYEKFRVTFFRPTAIPQVYQIEIGDEQGGECSFWTFVKLKEGLQQ
ncbi:hypothetical protein HDU76_012641 [Blyttiomyces sp. JEL0837]|nr:hypothetical protein HDU76_012641 [Blyttiomyces sp. JEL0837]